MISRTLARARTARRSFAGVLAGAALAAAMALLGVGPAAAATQDCGGLVRLQLPHVKMLLAAPVEGAFHEDTAVGRPGRTYTGLPAFCRVRGVSHPTADSSIQFEVWLPAGGWSGRLHMVGNGAYISNLGYKQMIARLADGDVAVATDTGHQGGSLLFGRGHPEKIADFGYRAVHESVVAAKAVTAAYYGRPARFAYFSGCSTGGYQGLSEAQRYPEDFDGIIAGAPGNNRTALTMAFLWNYLANHRRGDDSHPILSVDDLLLINRAVTADCDGLDGVKDGVVSDPRACRFDLASLRCAPADPGPGCLTGEQIGAAEKIYAGPHDSRGDQIFPGFPFGSEGASARPGDPRPGWSQYWADSANPREPDRADLFRYWVFDDPDWNWWTFDWDRDPAKVRAKLSAIFDAVDPDLDRFRARGGKLIMFIGWQDPVGTAAEAIDYYDEVQARAPGRTPAERRAWTQAFLRLFVVPGMGHCAGGPGATNFSTATRDSTPPIKDPAHDMTRALEAWVEEGRAPTKIIATRYADGAPGGAPRAIAFQRPLCPYPQVSAYRGGNTNLASSFVCVSPLSSTPSSVRMPTP